MKLLSTIMILLALSIVPALSARADQIDYLIQYNNQAQYNSDNLPTKHGVVADGTPVLKASHAMIVRAWRPSQDTTDQDGNVVHNYLPGIWLLISVVDSDTDVEQNDNLELSFNRNKCNSKAVGCLKSRHINAPPTQDIRYEPVYQGADIPFGNIQ